mgnify:FL=1
MFGDTFSNNSLGDLQKTYYQQLETLNRMQQQQQATNTSILEEINKSVGMLNSEEQSVLANSHDYQLAKQTYEAGFMTFLGNKFAGEYVSSPDGKIAAENLLNAINKSKEKIAVEIKKKQEKLDTMLNLLENDPEIKKRYDELMLSKQ